MEALKHNFLFKSYFEERGYMEKADFEIRESAIEASYDNLEQMRRELERRQARLDKMKARLEARRSGGQEDAATSDAATTGSSSAGNDAGQ